MNAFLTQSTCRTMMCSIKKRNVTPISRLIVSFTVYKLALHFSFHIFVLVEDQLSPSTNYRQLARYLRAHATTIINGDKADSKILHLYIYIQCVYMNRSPDKLQSCKHRHIKAEIDWYLVSV